MRRQEQTSTWPFLLVLAGLFVLSVLAPRSWQKIAVAPKPLRGVETAQAVAARTRSSAPVIAQRRFDRNKHKARVPQPAVKQLAAHEPSSGQGPVEEFTAEEGSPQAASTQPLRWTEPQPKIASQLEVSSPDEPMLAPQPASTSKASIAPESAVVAEPVPAPELAPVAESAALAKRTIAGKPASVATIAPPATSPKAALAPAVSALPTPEPQSESEPSVKQGPTPRETVAPVKRRSPRVASRSDRPTRRPDLNLPEQTPSTLSQADGFWEEPEALLVNLERLALDCEAAEWAARAIDLIRKLNRQSQPDSPQVREALAELRNLISSSHPQLAALSTSPSAGPWRRILHAISRRLDLWQLAPSVASGSRNLHQPAAVEHARLSDCLAEVAALTDGDPAGASWRQYLQLELLRAMADRRLDADSERLLARRVIERLERAAFDERQRQFISSGPLAALDQTLHHWVAEPVNAKRLIATLERYESSYLPSDAHLLALSVKQLAAWPAPVGEQAHDWLEQNYRNANLRISISEDFLNRLVPRQDPIEAPVRDRILGVPTRGWSKTTADLGIRLIPDPYRVRLALEVQGLVSARTTSRSGPATIYSRSDGEYLARKEIAVGLAGVHTQPAYADASNNPQLQGIETDYDNVPLLGLVIESVARVKHAEQESKVRRISRQKVASRVQEELDSTVEARLKAANEMFRQRVLKPLQSLQLDPSVVAMQTNDDRITIRVRLAAEEQLAACTPRPLATSDSLASVQIHQSLLNNLCERMELDGRTFALPELQKHLAASLGLDSGTFNEDYPADMRITFAKRDAVRIRFTSGRIMVGLAIAELRNSPTSWRDFHVRVFYKPVRRGLDLSLARDGTVQLWGERFGAQPQIALRGIFSRVFSQDRQLNLLDPKLAADPRLAGLEVIQCITTDGWLGLAIGPRRTARTARRPEYSRPQSED